jgi:SRSO17 transposase
MGFQYVLDRAELEGDLGDFSEPVRLHKVDETKWEPLWDKLVREHHYLGYESQIGCRIKYLVTLGRRLVGAISYCSAAYKLGPRDKFIGWDEETRLAMLPHIVNNNRFLILPWIKVRNLASRVLSMSLKRLRLDWKKQYDIEPYMAETFVDSGRYLGTCYAAANWICLGQTKGFSRQGKSFVYHGQPKDLYVIVLNRRFSGRFRPDVSRLSASNREELLAMINGIPLYRPGILEEMGVAQITQAIFDECFLGHISPYLPYLNRKELIAHFVAMEKGFLSDLTRKTVESIAIAFEGVTEVKNLKNFMTRSTWDDQGMLGQYQKEVGELLSDPQGMITGDGCDFRKQGKNSAGVARQCCGPLGKIENCQASVMVGYAGKCGYSLVDYELFIPEIWHEADYAEKRKACRIPNDLRFKTKNKLLLEMIVKLIESKRFKGKYVGVDCSFGSDHNFLDSLPEGLIYFAAVRSNTLVFPSGPDKAGSRQPARVCDLAADDSVPWQDVVLGIGAKGPICAQDKRFWVTEARKGKPGKGVWLYVRRLEDTSVKYVLCNESAEATYEAIRTPALMRWSIEQCFKECKTHLGMAHYEVRTWPAWRRHMLLVLIAHLFVTKLRRKCSARAGAPGPGPVIDAPAPLEEHCEAVKKLEKNEPLNHKHIQAFPKASQWILTIGLIKKLISVFLPKVGLMYKELDFELRNLDAAFTSNTRKKIDNLVRGSILTPEGAS